MSGASAPPTLTETIGRYEVVGQLAVGGMATILLGRLVGPRGFERPVVIKRILPHLAKLPEFVDMFVDEARIVAGIRHPNVVQVHELAREGDELYLVMEYLEGESIGGLLRRLVSKGERFDQGLAAHVVAEACAGLHAAHELTDDTGKRRGLVHRDVSPQNVVVTYAGQVKVLDFGIAKAADRYTKTEAGQLKGKYEYMSPEQCSGKPLDRRSDIFALGILLYELSTGKRLFKRDSELATLKAICEQPVTPPSDVVPDYPPALDAICGRALARRPGDRYATAAEMRRDLVVALRELGGEVMPEEALGKVMQRLFADRIEDKRDMLRRIRLGSEVTHLPAAESDASVDIPVAEEGSVIRSTADVVTARERKPARGIALPVAIAALGVAVLALAWRERSRSSAAPPVEIVATAETASSPSPPPSAIATTTVQPGAELPPEVVIRVETTPPGARVVIAGDDKGATPIDVRVPRGRDALKLELLRDGYAPLVQSLVPDVDQRLVLSLAAQGRGRPKAATGKPAGTAAPDDGYHRFQ